jgi:hypothetical protein
MKRIIEYPIKTYTALLLLMLVIAAACKKDKIEPEPIVFKIAGYHPNSGNAGTLVTIEGEGFNSDLSHYSASVSGKAAEVVSATPTYLVIMVPAGTGSGKIEVKYSGQTFDVGVYTYQALSVKGISPGNGPVGTNIRISGEGFANNEKPATVFINGNQAVVISLTDTLIIATVPDKTSSGPVEVKVQDKSSKGAVFRVQAIYDISPKTGGKGTKVTLKGSGFEKDLNKNQVTFNGKQAQVLEGTENQLVVLAPDGVETGMVALKIDGTAIEGPSFTVVAGPTINTVSPLSGPAGTEMTIIGQGFSEIEGETKVSINNKDILVSSVSNTVIKLRIPENIGTGKVKVTVNDQLAEGPVFTDQNLGIIRTDPEGGLAGTVVTIFGTGFGVNPADNTVTFNGVSAQVTSASATQLKVKVPSGASTGLIRVRVNGKEAVSPKVFSVSGVNTLTKDLSPNISSIAVGLNGIIYATDPVKHQVMKISTDGTVTLFAGSSTGQSGDQDGVGTSAKFNSPIGITIDKQGNLFIVEVSGNVKKISTGGQVTTLHRGVTLQATAIAIDQNNNIYVSGAPGSFSGLVKISASGNVETSFNFFDPDSRVGIDGSGTVYASDLSGTGKAAIGIGSIDVRIGSFSPGFADGNYESAQFAEVGSILFNGKGQLLVADYGNNALRLVDLGSREVSTIFKAERGYTDGGLNEVKFGELTDIAIAPDGTVYVLDRMNKAIRRIIY